jgi:hypothetical protein
MEFGNLGWKALKMIKNQVCKEKREKCYISKEVLQVLVKEGLEAFNEKQNAGDKNAQKSISTKE